MVRKTFDSIYMKKMHKKIIFAALIIMIIPMIIQIVISCTAARQERRIRISELNEQYLTGTSSVFSLIVNQINGCYFQGMANSSIRSFESSYIGKQYEEAKASGEFTDWPHIYLYIELKNEMRRFLKEIAVSNEYIKSIYFYDADKNIILTDSGADYPADSFYDMEWLGRVDSSKTFTVMPTRALPGGNEKVNSIIFPSINKPGNYMVVNVGYEDIFGRVMLQLPNKSYSDFFVTDTDGSLIYASDSELFERYSKYSFDTTVEPVSEFARKHLMSYLYDKEYQWFFVVLSDLDGMYENIIPVRTIFWIVTMFVVIIALLVFMVIVDYFSSPILRGIDTTIKRNGMDAESTFSGFKKILSKNVRLQEWMSENKPLYRDSFIISLLHINSIKDDEIRNTFEMLNIPLELENIMIAVVRTDFAEYTKEQAFSEIVVMGVMLEELTDELFRDNFNIVCTSKTESEFVILIQNKSDEQIPKICGILEQLGDKMTASTGIVYEIGLSRIADTIHDIPRAYDETVNMLKYTANGNTVNYCGEKHIEEAEKQETIRYSLHDLKLLSGVIAAGDRERAEECFVNIKAEVIKQSTLMTRNNFKYLIIEVLHELIAILLASGHEIDNVFGKECNIYSEITERMDINLIFNVFEAIIQTALTPINRETEGDFRIDEIIKLINEDCGENISLTSIADKLQLTPAYISRIFKQQMNMNFNDYLTRVRMEKAKQLLSESTDKIKTIANKVGYCDSYYFSKIFKGTTGMTPGQYRKNSR